jgi:hypothetical protein
MSLAASPAESMHANGHPALQRKAGSGLNIVGYFHDKTGIGQAARSIAQCLHSEGFPIACTVVQSRAGHHKEGTAQDLPPGHPYGVNLFQVNADQMDIVRNELGPHFFRDKYNIAFWFWEVSPFPETWLSHFRCLDEVWVGSRFVQNTLAQVAPVPVVNMGLPVPTPRPSRQGRVELGLPDNRFLFLFVFDMLSVFERKNPLGLVEAYRRAFGPDFKDTALVIKVIHSEHAPRHARKLRKAMASVSGLLLDEQMEREELDGLFQSCDAYVSLHRSEGFGLTLAEAMYLQKPVIATAYSGNTDFMNPGNSYLVDYQLTELDRDCGPYPRGSIWADPDLDHAAEQMRQVFQDQGEPSSITRRAAAEIERQYSMASVSTRIAKRLAMLETTGQTRREPGLRTEVDLAQMDKVWKAAAVNSHLPIAWPNWPKGLLPKAMALAQKVTRRLLRWYVDPIVQQQNEFNAAVAETLDRLWRQVYQQQTDDGQARERAGQDRE